MTELLAFVSGALSTAWVLSVVQIVRTTKREDD